MKTQEVLKMYESDLKKYKNNNYFTFETRESLETKCNAPTDKSGIYLIYKIIDTEEELLYIGSSGQIKDGILKTRSYGLGGMKDRIVNGYQPKFGKIPRKKAIPAQMKKENISKIKIYWWITYDDEIQDIPSQVENSLINEYLGKFGTLPGWHK